MRNFTKEFSQQYGGSLVAYAHGFFTGGHLRGCFITDRGGIDTGAGLDSGIQTMGGEGGTTTGRIDIGVGKQWTWDGLIRCTLGSSASGLAMQWLGRLGSGLVGNLRARNNRGVRTRGCGLHW